MPQEFHIERVRRQTPMEMFRAVTCPTNLFNGFYALFGFIISGALFAAAFMSFQQHPSYLPALFGIACGSTCAWGLAYGAWTDRLRLVWAVLTALTTLAMLAALFVALTTMSDFGLVGELIGGACGAPAIWAILLGIRKMTS